MFEKSQILLQDPSLGDIIVKPKIYSKKRDKTSDQ